jgi:hypothetical protein
VKVRASTKTCFNCIHLRNEMDAAGGGTYECDRRPGLVLAEYGHWVRIPEAPIPLKKNCKEFTGVAE